MKKLKYENDHSKAMNRELDEIKYIRKKLNLTQKQLADKAGVSQSLIAKIESGRVEPTYSNAVKILDALDNMAYANDHTASDLMNKSLIVAQDNDDVASIAKMMRKHEISQIPVVKYKTPVGLITESTILEKMMETKNPHEIAQLKARDIKSECPPVISPDTKQSAILGLLKYFPAVLVANHGELVGVITKADLLELIKK